MRITEDTGTQTPQAVWINWVEHILSFHEEVGYERLDFPSNKEKMDYVFEKASNGFRIQ